MTAQDRYQDLLLAYGVDLVAFREGLVRRLIRALVDAESDVYERVRRALEGRAGPGQVRAAPRPRSLARQLVFLAEVRELRRIAWARLSGDLVSELEDLALAEAGFQREAIREAVAIRELRVSLPAAESLRAIVTEKPFQGAPVSDWVFSYQRQDLDRVERAVRLGLMQGQSVDEIVKTLRGTSRQGFKDGVVDLSRRQAEDLVRTAVNHTSNAARELVWDANADIIDFLYWIATLDGRTSAVCRSRDGRVTTPAGGDASKLPRDRKKLDPPGARPPAHPGGCRSAMGAGFNAVGIVGERPFVTSTLRGRERRVRFSRMARARAGPARWRSMDRRERAAATKAERVAWARRHVGRVPSKTTYEEFVGRAPHSLQDEWLGVTKARLFRDGGLDDLGKFVHRDGRELTIAELRTRYPAAFRAAGID